MSVLKPAATWTEQPLRAASARRRLPSDGHARSSVAIATSPARTFGPPLEIHTPFLTAYGLDGVATAAGPLADLFSSCMAESYDPGFEEAAADLVHEAAALALLAERVAVLGTRRSNARLTSAGKGEQ